MSNPSTYMALAKQAVPAMRRRIPIARSWVPRLLVQNGDHWLMRLAFNRVCSTLWTQLACIRIESASAPETAATDYATVRSLMQTYRPQDRANRVLGMGLLHGTTGSLHCGHTSTPRRLPGTQFLVNLSQGIPLSIWYDWKNDGTDPTNTEQNFGTVTADLVPKPAYKEMQLLTSSLQGETFTSN